MQWQDIQTGKFLLLICLLIAYSTTSSTRIVKPFFQDTDSWITAHNHMFSYFGCSAKIFICNNLKTEINKHIKSETRINRIYQGMVMSCFPS
jgi:hypothetical protein